MMDDRKGSTLFSQSAPDNVIRRRFPSPFFSSPFSLQSLCSFGNLSGALSLCACDTPVSIPSSPICVGVLYMCVCVCVCPTAHGCAQFLPLARLWVPSGSFSVTLLTPRTLITPL
eukprot:GGOE01021232.1.p1 GENE.GGOE01021232.1~~GGOE01021232.1.p1  ORF type:complete len:115 (-),score=1.41 GGOE01021232.1:80-424(-)